MIYDSKKKWRFQSQPATSFNLGGSGTHPFFLKRPYPVSPNSKFLGRYTSLDPANTTEVQLVLLIYVEDWSMEERLFE